MNVDQSTFRAALLDPELPVPQGLLDKSGAPAGRRFSVYRNNVAVSLGDALRTGFPVLEKLIGQENFKTLAGLYLRAHPPRSPLMMHYGTEMPGFLEHFAPLQHIPYLGDVARLELAIRQSYHAADATPVPADRLACLTETSRLTFAGAMRLLPSDWPLWDIWHYNTGPDAPKPRQTAQSILITRPGYDPAPHALSAAEFIWLTSLLEGAALSDALDAATAADPAFDMTPALTLLVQGGVISDIT